MDPQLVVAALVARVLDVAALFAILAFYMIISRKTAEKKQAESESEPKPTEPEQKPKKKLESESEPKPAESEPQPKPAESEPKPKPTDPDWEWPIYDEHFSRKTHSYERKLRGENKKNKNKDNPFEVTYRKQKDWPDEVFVTLISSHLVEVITQCLPKNKEMTDTTPKLSGRDLFLAMHTIRNYKIIEEQSETAKVATPKKQLEESEIATASAKKVSLIDPISNKGEGCIFLCYGPPGTGKTLTAESVAEKLHRPLWAVSASELSFEVDKLEQKLVEILDIASSWHAVLLLDEADIYLEKRNSAGDPKRNAMTGIFLRLLEYYKGVLFLTTNRVTIFDDAFCSRISMFIRYHRLTHFDRAKVWENLLSRVGLMDVDLDMFAAHELNGREIRNSIRTAHTWATNCKQPLTTQHVLSVVKMLENFREDLQDAVLEESQIDNPFSSVLATLQQQQSTILCNDNTYSNGDMSSKP